MIGGVASRSSLKAIRDHVLIGLEVLEFGIKLATGIVRRKVTPGRHAHRHLPGQGFRHVPEQFACDIQTEPDPRCGDTLRTAGDANLPTLGCPPNHRLRCGCSILVRSGGEGGIRTPDTLSGMPVFKTGAINHSATSPQLQFYYNLEYFQDGLGRGLENVRVGNASGQAY